MRILHCIPNMNSGGAERQLTYLCVGLVQLGHEVHVLLARKGEMLGDLEQTGATIHFFAAGNNHSPAVPVHITKIIRLVKPDIVQTWLRQMDIAAGLASLPAKSPWIISERSSERNYPWSIKHQLRAMLGRWADAVICNSQAGRAYWEKMSWKPKTFMIPNAVPIDAIDAAAPLSLATEGLDPSKPIVIFVGRLSEEKNLDVFLRAVAQVRTTVAITTVICGGGPQRQPLEELATTLGLQGNVLLLGYVANIWSWLKRAALFVSLSRFEGNPNTVLEAMACHCPMVLSDIPAHREVCTERMAAFVDPSSSLAASKSIVRLLTDRAAAVQQATEARAQIENRSIQQMAASYLSVYDFVKNKRGKYSSGLPS